MNEKKKKKRRTLFMIYVSKMPELHHLEYEKIVDIHRIELDIKCNLRFQCNFIKTKNT